MELWQLMACLDGYAQSKGVKPRSDLGDLSEERLAEMGIEGFN